MSETTTATLGGIVPEERGAKLRHPPAGEPLGPFRDGAERLWHPQPDGGWKAAE